MHEAAAADIEKLIAALAQAIVTAWPTAAPRTALLNRAAPAFEF